jgi:hypothetical protein
MVAIYPAKAVKFKVICLDPKPGLEGLERVSINTNENIFLQILPERDAKFLGRSTQHEQPATEEQSVNPSEKPRKIK